jgi:hypothetical protein
MTLSDNKEHALLILETLSLEPQLSSHIMEVLWLRWEVLWCVDRKNKKESSLQTDSQAS